MNYLIPILRIIDFSENQFGRNYQEKWSKIKCDILIRLLNLSEVQNDVVYIHSNEDSTKIPLIADEYSYSINIDINIYVDK